MRAEQRQQAEPADQDLEPADRADVREVSVGMLFAMGAFVVLFSPIVDTDAGPA